MSDYSFNLLDQPWIPVVESDGHTREVGLLEVFRRAHELKEIADPSPLVTVALYRLCLAILHRVFGPPDLQEWAALWARGSFDVPAIEGYLENWRDRFELFHPEYPFYQVPGYEAKQRNYLSKLAHEMATGNNPTLFDHRPERDCRFFSPASAARLTVGVQSFGIGFGISPTKVNGKNISFQDGPLVRGAVSFLASDNLFRTLMLNLVRYNGKDLPVPCGEHDMPRWERKPGLTFSQRMPDGYLDVLTWQCRAMRLLPEPDGNGKTAVRYVHYGQGEKLDDTNGFREPAFAFREDQRTGLTPVKINQNRQLWRDSTVLLNVFDPSRFRPCEALHQLHEILAYGEAEIDAPVSLRVTGLTTEPGKASSVLLWRSESLPFNLDLLRFEDNIHVVEKAVLLAEEAGAQLHSAVRTLAREMLKADAKDNPDKDAVSALAACLSREDQYWAALNKPFTNVLLSSRSPEENLRDWRRQIHSAATKSFALSEDAAGVTARAYRARAIAGAEFRSRLAGLLDREEVNNAA